MQPNVSAESFLRQLEKGEKEVHSQGQELPSDETRREGKKAEEGIDISVGSAALKIMTYNFINNYTHAADLMVTEKYNNCFVTK